MDGGTIGGIWGLLAAIIIPSVVAILLYLFRHSLKEYITSGIKHSFELKIEAVRADLHQKEGEIAALREGALSGLSSRLWHSPRP